MALERMGVQPFRTEEVGKPKYYFELDEPIRVRRQSANIKQRSRKREWKLPASLLVKIGVCAAACALMLGLKEFEIPVAANMVSSVRSAMNEEPELDETLGKLQFVELQDALEVFSSESKMVIPVTAPRVSLEEEAQYVMWEGAPNAQVCAAAAGQVRAVGEDEMLGPYVRLLHADDLETIYYGLAAIQVEEGQPIRKHDTLGTLGEAGMLRLRVLLAGQPQSPGKYMDLVLEK